jgi:hypothetical protein
MSGTTSNGQRATLALDGVDSVALAGVVVATRPADLASQP